MSAGQDQPAPAPGWIRRLTRQVWAPRTNVLLSFAGHLHEISERGTSLSSGQRQLIALARAELVDRPCCSHDDLVARDGRYAAMWRAFELVSAS